MVFGTGNGVHRVICRGVAQFAVWLAHLNGVQGVGGSSPPSPTIFLESGV